MLTQQQIDCLAPKMKVAKIITFGIIMGAFLFGIVIAAIVDWDNVSTDLKMITLFGAATAVSMYVLSFVIPMVMSSSSADAPPVPTVDDQQLDSAFQTYLSSHIIHCAMLEGGIFLNLMVFMIERSLISLIVAGLGFGILLVAFPSNARIASRVSDLL